MPEEYSRLLAIAVKQARSKLGWTQEQLSEYSTVDVRTIINIEKGRGNPKLEKLFPLIRALHLDSREIFDSQTTHTSVSLQYLKSVLDSCKPEELETLRPVIEAVLTALRSNASINIE